MRILHFTRVSDGLPVYVQSDHIVIIRSLESDPTQTIIITLSEVDVVKEDLDHVIALWRGTS